LTLILLALTILASMVTDLAYPKHGGKDVIANIVAGEKVPAGKPGNPVLPRAGKDIQR